MIRGTALVGRSADVPDASSSSHMSNQSFSVSPAEAGPAGVQCCLPPAEDDTLAPYKDSRAMAVRVPSAQFVSVRRGGHTLTQLDAGARQAVADFIHAATIAIVGEVPLDEGRQHGGDAVPGQQCGLGEGCRGGVDRSVEGRADR